MIYRQVTYTSGLGLKSPMHLHYNVSSLRVSQPRITHFVAAAGMDAGCDHGGAHTPPYNCHDIANWQHSVVKVYLDGALVGESPVLQAETLQWVSLWSPSLALVIWFVSEVLVSGRSSTLACRRRRCYCASWRCPPRAPAPAG
jgi:hypothetical protein